MGSRRVLVTDLDGTLLGSEAALARFREWAASNRSNYLFVYASGRHAASIHEIEREEALPRPDAVISSVGTEIYERGGRPWPGWTERFAGWQADRIREVLRQLHWLEQQPAERQTRFKASYTVQGLTGRDLARIRGALTNAGLTSTIVYSSGRDLDILPAGAGKGRAARFVTDGWGVPPQDVLAFGDTGNDIDLLGVGYRGTIVGNALSELDRLAPAAVYRSPCAFADGILDGIRHWSATSAVVAVTDS